MCAQNSLINIMAGFDIAQHHSSLLPICGPLSFADLGLVPRFFQLYQFTNCKNIQTTKQGNVAMRCKAHIFILMPRNSHSIFTSSCIDIGQCTLHVWTLIPGGVLQSKISWKSENPTLKKSYRCRRQTCLT